MSFVDPVSDWYSASVPVFIYVISYNIGPRYNGTQLYKDNLGWLQWRKYWQHNIIQWPTLLRSSKRASEVLQLITGPYHSHMWAAKCSITLCWKVSWTMWAYTKSWCISSTAFGHCRDPARQHCRGPGKMSEWPWSAWSPGARLFQSLWHCRTPTTYWKTRVLWDQGEHARVDHSIVD